MIGIIKTHIYEYHLGLGYAIVLNLFGNGSQTTMPNTKNKPHKIIRGKTSSVCLKIKTQIIKKRKEINPYLPLKA